jgi:uncharacterized protein YndB with AHSA1/START domain
MNKPGKLEKHPDGYTIILERVYDHPIDKVWEAITNPDKMSMWFTDVEWEFKPGGRITFIFQDEDKTRMTGEIKTIDAPRLLEYEWHNDEPPHEFAKWELFEVAPDKTKLVLAYSRVIEDYAIGVSAGWHITLDDLERLLNGETEFEAFGGGETEKGRAMKKVYEDVFKQTFGK